MTTRVSISPEDHKSADFYRLMISAIGPRPIALVSTMSASGAANVSPFSFFMGVGSNPPCLAFSAATPRGPVSEKDTLANIRETKEFVVAMVTERNMHRVSQSSFEYPRGTDEFEAAGLAHFPALHVRARCVADSPVNFECSLVQIVPTGDEPGSGTIIVGRIIHAHVDERALVPGTIHCDPDFLALVGRMGGNDYSLTRERVQIPRPKSATPDYDPTERLDS
jgi:flavin reductase (DIM6/NTAB) family NADH-FMN oxidoreductase RutF